MNVLIASVRSPFVTGGAESLASALVRALAAEGHRADLLDLPFFPNPPEAALSAMHVARALEIGGTNFGPIDRVITLKFPAYLVAHPAKVLWLVHQYRQMYELWDEPDVGLAHLPLAADLRDAVRRADAASLPQHRRRFAISRTVSERLQRHCGLDAEPLYPPLPDADGYFCADPQDYFLCPARLSPLKRQRLLLHAVARATRHVRVVFIGGLENREELTRFERDVAALGLQGRVQYLGSVGEAEKRRLFAECRGVVCPTRLEDLGLVAQEAMLSSKAVVTCTDSGGLLEFVAHDATGLVVEPDPAALADALDTLWTDRPRARRLGRSGCDRLTALALSWPHVVGRLLE